MPITPDYSFTESETVVTVQVKLTGANPKNCDVFVSDLLLKVNRSPHLLVLDLHAAVDDAASTVSYTPEGVTVNLRKAEAAVWGVVKADAEAFGGKKGLTARREASIARQHEAVEAARQQRITAASANKRMATHAGIDIDRAQRQLIDDRKAAEKAQAEAEMYAELEKNTAERTQPQEESSWEEAGAEDAEQGEEELWEEVDETEALVEEPEPEPEPEPSAPLRSYASGPVAPISFTSTNKPAHLQHLPARTKPEDMPSAETAPKIHDDDAVDLGEQNALFLKDRGDGFFGRRDYEAAVNAYSAALTLDRNLPAVFSNRAACYFCLSDYAKCEADCTSALKLLRVKKKEVTAERSAAEVNTDPELLKELEAVNRSLLRALARRASARTLTGDHEDAVADYEEAVALDPGNEGLEADLEAARESAVEAQTVGVAKLKAEADGHFGGQQFAEAKACYSKALKLAGGKHLGSLSNRAACCLMLGEDGQCVTDCTAALTELGPAAAAAAAGEEQTEEAAKEQRTRLRLHVRRGTAAARMGDVAGARTDYEAAKLLSTSAAELAALEKDLAKLIDPSGLDLD